MEFDDGSVVEDVDLVVGGDDCLYTPTVTPLLSPAAK